MTPDSSVPVSDSLSPDDLMREIQEVYPGAQRTLFRHFHIGGCRSCAFSPEESLAALCQRNQIVDPVSVLEKIRSSHAEDTAFFISPNDLKELLAVGGAVKLLDIRTSEEFDAVHIPGSVLMSQPVMQEIMAYWNPTAPLILIDHLGQQSLDAAAYFAGHGLKNVRCLSGGIDAWALQVDGNMPRYEWG